MRRTALVALIAGVAFLAGIAAVHGTPSEGASRTIIADAIMADGGSIDVRPGTETQVLRVTIAPGGSTGWHTHPDAGVFMVDSGTLTNYGLDGAACEPVTIEAGQAAFVPPHPHHPHLGRNEGTEPLEITVTYFNVPPGEPSRADAEPPAECPPDLR